MKKRVGTRCWMKGAASVASLKQWKKYQQKGLQLSCPCNCFGKELEVVEVLSDSLALLQLVGFKRLTIAVWDDLTTLAPEAIQI